MNIYFVGAPTFAKGIIDFEFLASSFTHWHFSWFCQQLPPGIKESYPHINFILNLNDHDLKEAIMSRMDIFISCSHFEGFCLPAAEAILAGKPVITYALEEVKIEFGTHFEYVPCFDLDEFMKTLEHMASSPPNKYKISSAQNFITQMYSPANVAKRFFSIIESI